MEPSLTALFVDCDSYFASVEQHLDPKLRGRPVAVSPVKAESTCCIAASYEAKAYGVKTGTPIHEARKLCPGITIVEGNHEQYVHFHHLIIKAVESCIHVEAALSIDEMWCWLPYNWRERQTVEELAMKIKAAVARDVSPVIKVSIGAGPNKWVAKVASKMRKPDGLFIIEPHEMPQALHGLELRDLHGIGRSMELRLHAVGIHSVEALCAAPKNVLHSAWGGIAGDRLWYTLRGMEIPTELSTRRSISHSHMLPPDSRSPAKAWGILCKLLHKGCERMRAYGMLAGSLMLHIRFLQGETWVMEAPIPETDSTLRLMTLLGRLWRERPDSRQPLLKVGMVLQKLCEKNNFTPQLPGISGEPEQDVQEIAKHQRLDQTLDELRSRYGRQVIFLGSVQQVRNAAPMRIAFDYIPDVKLDTDGG